MAIARPNKMVKTEQKQPREDWCGSNDLGFRKWSHADRVYRPRGPDFDGEVKVFTDRGLFIKAYASEVNWPRVEQWAMA